MKLANILIVATIIASFVYYTSCSIETAGINGITVQWNEIKPSDQTCKLNNKIFGFYQLSFIAIVEVKTFQDCMLLCMRLGDCVSGNYMKKRTPKDTGENMCVLAQNTEDRLLKLQRIAGSTYFDLSCGSRKKRHNAPVEIYHGELPKMCGVVAFNERDYEGLPKVNKRIVGGSTPTPYTNPWLGQMTWNGRTVCGVILFVEDNEKFIDSTSWVLTAAHCFGRQANLIDFPSQYTEAFDFLFGVHDLQYYTPHLIHRNAKRIFFHPDYQESPLRNDLALVKLTKPVRFNDFIRPICLPTKAPVPMRGSCTICGFGVSDVKSKTYPKVLKCLPAPVDTIPVYIGEPTIPLNMGEPPIDWATTSYTLRRGPIFKGLYKGDSGGPLTCTVKRQATVLGIMYGMANVSGEYYLDLYVRVPEFKSWIQDVIYTYQTVSIRNNQALPKEPKPDKNDQRNEMIFSCFPNGFRRGCFGFTAGTSSKRGSL